MKDLKEIIMESYLKWIRDNTFLKDLRDDTIKIVSPFLDVRNDYITLYVRKISEDKFRLSDGGLLYSDLNSAGIKLTDKRELLFNNTLQAYGVKRDLKTNELYIESNLIEIGKAKHRIIQCLVTLNDFFNYTEQNVKELFFYDVYNTLKEKNIQFNYNFQLLGTSGFGHKIDFGIGVTKAKSERLIKLVANPTHKQLAELCLFAFIDLEKANREFIGIILYKGKPSSAFLDAFEKYNYKTLSWDEEKEEVMEILEN